MYFTENSVKIPEEKRKRLIFLRACDLNALKRLDEIYLHNGPEDFYYKNIRENAKFILMGCSQSFKSCFCVSMGTNQAENYDGYAHPAKEGLHLELKDEVLSSYAEGISVPRDSQAILSALPLIAAGLFVMYIAQSLCKYYVSYQGHMMGANMERDMRQQLFDHYERLSFSYYSLINSRQMLSKLVSDLFYLADFPHH